MVEEGLNWARLILSVKEKFYVIGSKMNFKLTINMEPPRAEIPKRISPIHAEIFGVDDESYFHIGFNDKEISDKYQDMHFKMENHVKEEEDSISLHRLKGSNVYCIVEHGGRRGGIYSRGKVKGFSSDMEAISIRLIDDFMDVTVSPTLVYPIDEEILGYPEFSLKCKLHEMDTFLHHPFLKFMYNEHIKGDWKPGIRRCLVEVLDPWRNVPTVRITSSSGKDMTNLLQEYIPVFSKMDFPDPYVPTKARVVNCDDSGKVWFHGCGDHQLIHLIKYRLKFLEYGNLQKQMEKSIFHGLSWKSYYFNGPGELFITKNPDDEEYYRVRLLQRNWDGTAEVYYIDYGFSANIEEESMVPAHWIDQNLSFIAPQCLAIKFIGADDNDSNPFNVSRFWKYVSFPVNIILRDYGLRQLSKRMKGLIIPEADILVRTEWTPSDHIGYSLFRIFNPNSFRNGERGKMLENKKKSELNGDGGSEGFFSNSSDSSPEEESPADSTFEGLDVDDTDEGTECSGDWNSKGEIVLIPLVSTLAASYYRQLRLLRKH